MLSLLPLTEDDLALVLKLKQQAGWNQTPADLDRFYNLSPAGSFVARWDDEPVGCVMTFEFGTVAWIAMMLVDEAFRGRGIGRELMQQALAHLDARGISTIRLDATPLGQPLYEKLGFVPQFQVDRYAGQPPEAAVTAWEEAAASRESAGMLVPACDEQIEDLVELDRSVTATDRRKLILALWQQYPEEARIVVHERRVVGYVMSRPGANASQIGPCLGHPSAAQRLLADALRRHTGRSVYVDVPTDNLMAVEVVQAHGLNVQRSLMRMCRGPLVAEDLPRLFASSSPEKG